MDVTVLGTRIATGLATFAVLVIAYKIIKPFPKKFGSNGRAIAYLLNLIAYPAILSPNLIPRGTPSAHQFSLLLPCKCMGVRLILYKKILHGYAVHRSPLPYTPIAKQG